MYDQPETECTAKIDGKLIVFDAQHVGSLKEAKSAYQKAFKYVGTTEDVWYGGIKDNKAVLHHIFVYKNRRDV